MNPKSNEGEFSGLRAFFWPIHRSELPKFLPMALLMFFILFNYVVLRGSKDTLVTSTASGASIIPFLKGYIVLPCSLLFVIFYSYLVDKMSREKIFYLIVSFFLAFFFFFAFFIYPNREALHPSPETILSMKLAYPALKHFVSVYEQWSFSIYYVFSELWGAAMISLLFWQFANDIIKTKEAKRFYAMFGLIANISLICAGLLGKYYFEKSKIWAMDGSDQYHYMNLLNISSVVISGVFILLIYRWINTKVLTNPRFYDPEEKKPKKKKPKMGVGESLKFLFSSKYLLMIALLVICYGISMNLIETLWKDQLKLQFPNKADFSNFLQNLFISTGVFTMIIILLSKSLVQKFGWFRGAICTPIVLFITGVGFFGFVFFGGYMSGVAAGLGTTSLMLSIWIGTAQNVFSKGVKYGLFDPTKEMAYIPLDKDSKTKGKAAIDVIGGRLGKAGGGYISSGLMIIFAANLADIAPILTVFVFIVVAVWVYAVITLNKLYHEKLKESKQD